MGQLLLLTTITHEVPLWDAFTGPLKDTVTATDWGGLWAWRMAAAAAFGGALSGLRFAPDLWQPAVRLLALALGSAALWALALTSHGAATIDIRNLALAAEFLHLVASAFWVGAIFHFALGIAAARRPAGRRPARVPRADGAAILGGSRDERRHHRRHRGFQRMGAGHCLGGGEHSLRHNPHR